MANLQHKIVIVEQLTRHYCPRFATLLRNGQEAFKAFEGQGLP